MPDAEWLAHSPGYSYHCGVFGDPLSPCHTGGADSLEVDNDRYGIYLAWRWGKLHEIAVFKGWQGKVAETGIRLGSSLDDFLSAYPDAIRGKPGRHKSMEDFYSNYCNEDEEIDCACKEIKMYGGAEEASLTAYFDKNKKLFLLDLEAGDCLPFTYGGPKPLDWLWDKLYGNEKPE